MVQRITIIDLMALSQIDISGKSINNWPWIMEVCTLLAHYLTMDVCWQLSGENGTDCTHDTVCKQ